MQAGKLMKKGPVNTKPSLDPKFGSEFPTDVEAYWIVAKPKSIQPNQLNEWFFLIIIPMLENEKDSQDLLAEVLHDFLEDGDRFQAKPFELGELDLVDSSLPIISFDPDNPQNFFWLKPPLELMH